MTEHWEDIYGLAELIEERHINNCAGEEFIEPIIERLEAAAVEFDLDWKDVLRDSVIEDSAKVA